MKKEISIIIPAYNEEARLSERLDEILKYLAKEKYDYEIIIVDDGSKDGTLALAQKYAKKNRSIRILQNGENCGKGYSVKRGMLAAKKAFILFTDSDKSTPINELSPAMKLIKDYDIVIGSRAIEGANVVVRQPLYKVLFGRAGNLLVQLLATRGIKDTQCGFKLFTKKALFVFKKQTIDRWGFDFEILFIARKNGLLIKEMPVTWVNDERTKLKFSNYFSTLTELLKIRWNWLWGKYGRN